MLESHRVEDSTKAAAISRLADAIVALVDSGTETIADDIWVACAEAGAELRQRTPGAAPVVRSHVNLEALGRLDQASRRFNGFVYFLLNPAGAGLPVDDV
jgi:hypothetical protein